MNPDPNLAPAVYQAPSVLPSEDLTSSGGPSLVPPTLATLDNIPIQQPTRSGMWPELPLHLEFDEKIRNTPFEIEPEGLSISSTTVTAGEDLENPSPLPWKFEFQWEDGVLHFSRGPLRSALVSSPRQPTEISSATAGDSSGISESTHATTVLAPRSNVSLHTAVHLESVAYWAMRERRGELSRILIDHYWRTHTSQGANQRNQETSQHITNFSRSAPHTTATPARPSTRGGSSRRLANSGGSGGGEDGDENDDHDDRFRHSERPVLERTRHFACPFQKWRPDIYKRCFHRHRNVCEVKRHVIDRHYLLRCAECHHGFRTPLALTAHSADTGCGARPTPNTTPGHISEQQRATIRKRPRGKSLERQWRDLFATIFPNEPQPRDVYVDRHADNVMQHITYHYHICCRHFLHMHQAERVRDDPFFEQFDTLEAQRDSVAAELTSLVTYDLGNQELSDWSPPFALHSDSRNYAPGTVAPGLSLFPPDSNQNQSLAHGFPPMLDSPRLENHSESTGLYNLQPLGPSHVPPLSPPWHLGSQFNIQPINLSNVNHTGLDHQLMTTHVVEQQPPVVPQLGQDFGAPLHRLPNEDLFAAVPQHMFQPGPHNDNNNGGINQATSIGSSTVAVPPFLPGTHGLAPAAEAGSYLYAPIPTNDACDNATTTALDGTFPRRHMQWVDVGSMTPSHFDSSHVP